MREPARSRFGGRATDNRNYQPGVLRLNIAPIGSVIPKNPGSSTAFKSLERQVGYRHCHAAILHYKKCRSGGSQSVRISGIELDLPNPHKPTTTIARWRPVA